jgi:hypothetical protein
VGAGAEAAATAEEPSANEDRDEKVREPRGEEPARNVTEEPPSEDVATADESESATSYTI